MANYNDYQLEEMENSAVEKSSMAKRAAAAAGLVGAGAATAYGATRIMDNGHDDADKEAVTTEDLTTAAQAGAVDGQSMNQTAQTTQAAPESTTEEVHVYHHNVEDKPVAEEDPEMEFDSTTHWYDDEGNLIGQTDEGTYDGKNFAVIDVDADGHGDYLAYDVNNDGVYQENEIASLDGYDYAMGQGTTHHYDRDINTGEELVAAHEPRYNVYGEEKENEIADIHNDFDDEKAGEEYENDLAQYNPDYRNNEDLGNQYNAGAEKAEEYAYEESGKYDDSVVEEKYELTAEETENELAYDTTESSDDSQEYALDDTSEMAYDDTESSVDDEYVQEETSDMAYDDSQADDMAQYDVV